MCIIMVKPAGKDLPDQAVFDRCFVRNKDGAGFMYFENNRVIGMKGYTSASALRDAITSCIQDVKENAIAVHFRYKTHGNINVANCHPFPVTDDWEIMGASCWEADIGLMHNGVMHNMPYEKDYSDTMSFVKHILYKHPTLMDDSTDPLLKLVIGHNRFAVMNASTKKCSLLGDWNTAPDGVIYSNHDWKEPEKIPESTYFGSYTSNQYNNTCAVCEYSRSPGNAQPCQGCLTNATRPNFKLKKIKSNNKNTVYYGTGLACEFCGKVGNSVSIKHGMIICKQCAKEFTTAVAF
jgi:hypothetical protein